MTTISLLSLTPLALVTVTGTFFTSSTIFAKEIEIKLMLIKMIKIIFFNKILTFS